MILNKKIIIVLIILAIPFAAGLSLFLGLLQNPLNKSTKTNDSLCENQIGDRNKFAVSDIYNGKKAEINFESFPNALTFKTQIEQGYKSGVNLAGHYNLSSWGCGTGCQVYNITDVIKGNIISYGLTSEFGAFYYPNSSLFIINPKENTPNPVDQDLLAYLELTTRRYYEVKNGSLNLICEESAESGIESI